MEAPINRRWSRARRDWAVALWVAFLTACGGTFALFALLDPATLGEAWVLGWSTGLRLTYGLGFLFCFVVGLAAAGLMTFMIRTGPKSGHVSGQGRRPPPEIHDPADTNPDLRGEKWH